MPPSTGMQGGGQQGLPGGPGWAKITEDDKIKITKNLLFLFSIHKIMFLFEIFDFLLLKLDICNDIIILSIWKLVKVVALLGQMTLFGCLMQY